MPKIAPEVLLYHRVGDSFPDTQYLSVSADNFEKHLHVLSRNRKVLPLFDILHAAEKGHLIENSVAITFDDGYADNLLNALPLLEKYKCHATIFVTAGMLGNPYGFWYDVLEDIFLTGRSLPSSLSLPIIDTVFPLHTHQDIFSTHETLLHVCKQANVKLRRLLLHEIVQGVGLEPTQYATPHALLTVEQLEQLSRSPWIEIGGHSLTHPELSSLNKKKQKYEIEESVKTLSKIIGKDIRTFAYPFGHAKAYDNITCEIINELGLWGIANIPGSISLQQNKQNVPRHLVRNWTKQQFSHWLNAADRDFLEHKTVAGRTALAMKAIKNVKNKAEKTQSTAASEYLDITHINTVIGKGGAANVMQMLQSEQERLGHNSCMLASQVQYPLPRSRAFDVVVVPSTMQIAQDEGLLDYAIQSSHALISDKDFIHADIVHYHNLHGTYFNPWSLAALSRVRPSVWTLHDMQALTGHCAHSFECTRWQTGCGLCPDLTIYPHVLADNTHRVWRDKQEIYACSPVHIVSPSQWLAGHVSKSSLAEHALTVIPNGIDLSVFTPQDKNAVREKLGISPSTVIIGSSAESGPLDNCWKGGQYALAVLHFLQEQGKDFLFLGRGNDSEVQLPHIRLLPYTADKRELAEFYSVLDFMLYPSRADNAPLVVMEAMACGVPVVAFGVGGIPELIDDGKNGCIVAPYDTQALCTATLSMVTDVKKRLAMGKAAQEKAKKEFCMQLMAQRYMQLYSKVQEQWKNLPQMQRKLHVRNVPDIVQTKMFTSLASAVNVLEDDATTSKNQSINDDVWRVQPLSRTFGFDRGTPLDRVYMEKFLSDDATKISGKVLEIGSNFYTKKFGTEITHSDVLNVVPSEEATIVGSLTDKNLLASRCYDCIILTQTLHVIQDVDSVLENLYEALAPDGVLLLTAPCISQISRFDMDRWGDFWRFTDKGLGALLQKHCQGSLVEVNALGNMAIAKAFLDGRAAEEVPSELFDYHDPDYQVLLTAKITKPAEKTMQHIQVEHNASTQPSSHASSLAQSQQFYPTQLAIEPVRGCNARCIMCPQHSVKRAGGILKTEHLTQMLQKVKDWGAPINLITHAGMGEPLLDKNLEEKIVQDKKFFPHAHVAIYTNAALLDKERIHSLMETGVDTISISLNALEVDTYKKIMGLERDVVYKNVFDLLELRKSFKRKLTVTVSCIPIPELPMAERVAFQKFWQNKADNVVIPPVINWGGDLGDVGIGEATRVPCSYIFSVLMVDFDGTVKRCCEDYDSKYPMGNLLSQHPSEIFNSSMMGMQRLLQLEHNFSQPPICRKCIETSLEVSGAFWRNGGGVSCL